MVLQQVLKEESLTKSALNPLLFNHLVNDIQSKRGNQRDDFSLAPMNLATHFDRLKRDFNFLRALAPVLLDGFSIGWYKEKLSTFLLQSLKAERCDFLGKKSLRRWSPFKTRIPPKEQ